MIGTIVLTTILCCLVVVILVSILCLADSHGELRSNVGAWLGTILVCFLTGVAVREAFVQISDADQASKNSAVIQSLPRSAEKP